MLYNKFLLLRILILLLPIIFLISCSNQTLKYINKEYRLYLSDSLPGITSIKADDSLALEYFIRGVQFEQQGLFADAIIEYEDAYNYDSSAVILYAIGKNYLYIYKFDKSEEYLKKAILQDSTLIPALEALGQVYIRSFRRKEAISEFEELYKISPNSKYLYTLAYLYEFIDVNQSIIIYDKLVNNDDDINILSKLAGLYLDKGDTAKYISTLEKAYRKSRDNSELITDLFNSYLISRNYKRASSLIDTTDYRLTTDDLSVVYVNIGQVLSKCNDKTADTLKKNYISKIDSRFYFNWPVIATSALISLSVGDTLKGEELLKRALNLADTVPELVLQMSDYYLQSGKFNESLSLINKYEKLFPDDQRFSDFKGFAYLLMDSLEKARDIYLISLKKEPDNSFVLTQLGVIYDRINLIDSSDYYYKQSLLLDPDDALTNNNYAYSLSLRKKDLVKALELSRKSLLIDSVNSSYLDTYGWILFQMGKYNEAIFFINKSIETGQATSEVYEHLGDIYLKKGDKLKAVESWEKGVLVEPENKILKEKINKFKP